MSKFDELEERRFKIFSETIALKLSCQQAAAATQNDLGSLHTDGHVTTKQILGSVKDSIDQYDYIIVEANRLKNATTLYLTDIATEIELQNSDI